MTKVIRVAGVQMDSKLFDKARNLETAVLRLKDAAKQGANLVVFPECALTGYCFASLEEAMPYGEPIPGPSSEALAAECRKLGVYAVAGLLERDGDRLFNAVVLVGPEGVIGSYRKVHLPYLGVDRFVTPGDKPFRVYDTGAGKIGLQICYDLSFPESSRVMALAGAELLVLSTNWPERREKIAAYYPNTRAMENRVHFMAIDRVGHERKFQFIGRSKIVDCFGNTVAEASPDKEETIYADLDLSLARDKKFVFIPGEFETDTFADRRPQFYGPIVGEHERVSGA